MLKRQSCLLTATHSPSPRFGDIAWRAFASRIENSLLCVKSSLSIGAFIYRHQECAASAQHREVVIPAILFTLGLPPFWSPLHGLERLSTPPIRVLPWRQPTTHPKRRHTFSEANIDVDTDRRPGGDIITGREAATGNRIVNLLIQT